MDKEIVLYSTGCPQCSVLKKKLDAAAIKYTLCTDADQMLKKGFQTVPMLDVGDKILNFSQAIKWIGEYTN